MTGTRILPRSAIRTAAAPPPAGTYSQAVLAGGTLYISGQTPRRPDGSRCTGEPFATQARLTLTNLDAIANAAGARLADAAFITVYLRDPRSQAAEFDDVYRAVVGPTDVPPARAVVQSDLPHGDIEVTAVIPIQTPEPSHEL
jgi:2-iminobutanoate/2-iminopropanoate deaminase